MLPLCSRMSPMVDVPLLHATYLCSRLCLLPRCLHGFVLPPLGLAVGGCSFVPSSPTPFALGFHAGYPTDGIFDPVLGLDALGGAAGDA
ncbi:hypothetical protein SUGI_1204510 [Cryptomeria japonica]|nr:hypothetical protein SUGI_1204510 [Cryptomeria japonica]